MRVVGYIFAVLALISLEIGSYQLSGDIVTGCWIGLLLMGILFVFSKVKKEAVKSGLSQKYISLAVEAGYFAAGIRIMIDMSKLFEKQKYEYCVKIQMKNNQA